MNDDLQNQNLKNIHCTYHCRVNFDAELRGQKFFYGKGSKKKICKFWDIGQISLTPPPL